MSRQVAVIGAGMAGVTCAGALVRAGLTVTLFDKGRRPGGRLATRQYPDRQFDSGAQFFTVRDPAFRAAVSQWVVEGGAAAWTGRLVFIDAAGTAIPATPADRLVGVPTMRSLVTRQIGDSDVRAGVRVAALDYRGDAWTVLSDTGASLGEFDLVLVTVPAPQAAPLLGEVPRFAAAAREAEYQACWTVMAEFSEPLDLPFDGAFLQQGPLAGLVLDSSKPGRPPGERWVLHGGSEFSRVNLESEPGSIEAGLLEALGTVAGRPLPKPVFVRAHRWRYAVPVSLASRRSFFDPVTGLGAGGDWCAGKIEGAWMSGMDLARRVRARYGHAD